MTDWKCEACGTEFPFRPHRHTRRVTSVPSNEAQVVACRGRVVRVLDTPTRAHCARCEGLEKLLRRCRSPLWYLAAKEQYVDGGPGKRTTLFEDVCDALDAKGHDDDE